MFVRLENEKALMLQQLAADKAVLISDNSGVCLRDQDVSEAYATATSEAVSRGFPSTESRSSTGQDPVKAAEVMEDETRVVQDVRNRPVPVEPALKLWDEHLHANLLSKSRIMVCELELPHERDERQCLERN